MHRYFALKQATPEKAPRIRGLEPAAPRGISLGEPIELPEQVIITFAHLNHLVSVGWAGNYFYLCSKLLDLVRSVGEKNFKEFPITAKSVSGKTSSILFSGVQILNNLDCMDKTKSKFTRFNQHEEISRMDSLILDEKKIPEDRHLFRVRDFPTPVIMSEKLANLFLSANVAGVAFVDTKDYVLHAYY